MLAQNFKSASDLGLTDPQLSALMKTLVLLETGKLKHVPVKDFDSDVQDPPSFTGHFSMSRWGVIALQCGTVACIGGTAELIAGERIFGSGYMDISAPKNLTELFYPDRGFWGKVTTAQAATALRSYLTTGDAKWHEAVA